MISFTNCKFAASVVVGRAKIKVICIHYEKNNKIIRKQRNFISNRTVTVGSSVWKLFFFFLISNFSRLSYLRGKWMKFNFHRSRLEEINNWIHYSCLIILSVLQMKNVPFFFFLSIYLNKIYSNNTSLVRKIRF